MYKIQSKLNEVSNKALLMGLFVLLIFGNHPNAFAFSHSLLAPNASNLPPTVNVGVDQSITLADRAFLYGVVSDDNLPIPGAILSVTWSKVSGPGTVTFGHTNDFLTWATFSTTGTYVVRLTVNDGQLTSSDDLGITVNATVPHTIRVPQDYSTIQAGINAAQNGDLVLVSPGTYTENLNLDKTITLASTFYTTGNPSLVDQTIISSPSIANPVILVGQLTGPTTKIIGFTIKNGDDGVKVHGKVSVFNGKFFTQAADAMDYANNAAGLVMDNYCEGNDDDCVDIDNADVLVERNQMVANGEGVEIRAYNHVGNQLTIIIRDNFITSSRKTALQLIDTDSIAPTTTFLLIERNLITNNPQSGLSMMDNGITTEDYRAASLLERIHVFNNTFVGNNYGISGGDNMVVVNNIFANHSGIGVKQVDGNSVLSHNLFWNNGTDNLGSNLDLATTLFANPLLDASYKLQSGSPAIDAGVPVFTLASGERVLNIPPGNYLGAAPDLGKYESNFAPGPNPTPIPSPTPTNTPPAPPTTFGDVPGSYWAASWIERLYNAGITGGCSTSPLMYCPDNEVTRAQIAVFLERGMHGASYTPPAASGAVFTDIGTSYWAAAWIERLAAEGITGGCGGGNYCPDSPVTRAQMAVFLLRAKHGSSYTPPAATGVFGDVPTSYWAAPWIEQLAAEGITTGCGNGNYCPDSSVTRAQMAVFLVRTFNLP